MLRAILAMTLLVLIKTAFSQLVIERCADVFESFMPCMGFIEGLSRQPSPDCCRGVTNLNSIVQFTPTGPRRNVGIGNGIGNGIGRQTERVCACIEIMGRAYHPPFLPTAINNLPLQCSLSLSFPISVAMDCTQFRSTKSLDVGNPN